jgi:hypothetical protein
VKWLNRTVIVAVIVSTLAIIGALGYLVDYVRDSQRAATARSLEILAGQEEQTRQLLRVQERSAAADRRRAARERREMRRNLREILRQLGGDPSQIPPPRESPGERQQRERGRDGQGGKGKGKGHGNGNGNGKPPEDEICTPPPLPRVCIEE